jgi:hypothetical protein
MTAYPEFPWQPTRFVVRRPRKKSDGTNEMEMIDPMQKLIAQIKKAEIELGIKDVGFFFPFSFIPHIHTSSTSLSSQIAQL